MEFKDFISKLYIKNAWSINKNKMTKALFTEYLFLNSVTDQSTITDKRNSESSFKGFNRGHSIAEIANDVLNNLYSEGISSFLKDTFNSNPDKKSENIKTICEKFKTDIPDITPDNIVQKITDFFIYEVLRPARKCKNPETVKSEKYSDLDKYNNESIDNADTSINVIDAMSYNPFSEVSKADIEDIRNLIINLSVTAESLVELGKEIGFNEFNIGRNTAIYEFEPLYTKFDEEYNEFCKLHKKSKFYYNKYPHLFSIIYSESPIIDKNLFLTSFSRSKYGGHEPYSIIEYIAKLSKLSIQLREYETK